MSIHTHTHTHTMTKIKINQKICKRHLPALVRMPHHSRHTYISHRNKIFYKVKNLCCTCAHATAGTPIYTIGRELKYQN